MSSPKSRRHVPPDGSWRLVEGENDSFDTSILPASQPDQHDQPDQPLAGQSQDAMDFSQDSIRDFANYRDDDNVILRAPFLPTLPLRPVVADALGLFTAPRSQLEDEAPKLRLRIPSFDSNGDLGSSTGSLGAPESSRKRRRCEMEQQEEPLPEPVPWSLAQRAFSLFRLVFNFIKAPMAIFLAMYILYNINVSFQLDDVSFSPLCRLPWASKLNVAFCQPGYSGVPPGAAVYSPNFKDIMDVQARFEDVLDKSQRGLAMPLELKRSEMATRSLRRLLKDSSIPSKDRLVSELNSYIDKVGRAGSDLQAFYIHVGSTVDAVINVNRWTLRHINSLAIEPEPPELPSTMVWITWLVSPFRLSRQAFNNRVLFDKYVAHITLVQDRLGKLVDEGAALSMLLYHSQNHLTIIYEHARRSSSTASHKPDSLLSGIWAYIGGMMMEQKELEEQISLLGKVDLQYASTISHLLSLIEYLKDIRTALGGLLQRSRDPSAVGYAPPAHHPTLGEQMETVKDGVKWLEEARRRARRKAAEGGEEEEPGPVHVNLAFE